jgi:hypothetical protein
MARGLRPALAVLAVSAGAIGALTGCSSPSSSSAPSATVSATVSAPAPSASAGSSDTPTSSAAPAPSMTSLPAAGGQLTGTQLAKVLLPESDFPTGFVTPSAGPVTSGVSLTPGTVTYDLATISCATFIQHLGSTGFGETAMVTGGVSDSGQAYDELIYQFKTAGQATAFVSGMQALAGRCASFTATDNGQSGPFHLQATAGSAVGGHPTLELLETGTVGTEKVVLDSLFCASGVGVFGAAGVGVNGADAPALPTKENIIYQLMQRQAAVSVLG